MSFLLVFSTFFLRVYEGGKTSILCARAFESFEFFTRLAFSGDITCSANFPEGKILLLEKVLGEQ